jgi:prepilin-type N-terminal cleavage/methylation domain-containing protein
MEKRQMNLARKGFSLVELLVVISIIALLAAILLPTLSQARDRAYTIVCLNNMRQVAIGFTVYSGDYDGWYPVRVSLDSHTNNSNETIVNNAFIKNRLSATAVFGDRNFLHSWWGLLWPLEPTLGLNEASVLYTRKKGKYFDNHLAVFCPIAIREQSRMLGVPDGYDYDKMFAQEGSGKRWGGNPGHIPLGYSMMLAAFDDEDGSPPRVSKRAKSSYRPLSASADPMCWMMTDLYEATGGVFSWWPHLRYRSSPENLVYNVVHLDGHACTHQAVYCVGWVSAGNYWIRSLSPPADIPYAYMDTDGDRLGR